MTNQFTDEQEEAQVMAGMRACLESADVPTGLRPNIVIPEGIYTIREQVDLQTVVEVVLKAAGVAPQAPEGRELDALRALIENRARVIEGFSGAPAEVAAEQKAIAISIRRDLEDHDFEFRVAPVQLSSTVDEGLAVRLAEMLYDDQTGTKGKFATSGWRDVWVRRTRAVVDAWRGESR